MSVIWPMVLALVGTPTTEVAIRGSIVKGLVRLETAAANYATHRTCFSCHHQAVPLMAMASARGHGFAINNDLFDKQVKFTLDTFQSKLKDIRNGSGIGGANTTAAYALYTLKTSGNEKNEVTDALVEFALKKQMANGSWPATTVRPPSEGSAFTSAALYLDTLNHFAHEETAEGDFRRRLVETKQKGLAFIVSAKPQTTEDHVFRLWGLVAGGAGQGEIRKAKESLLQRQRIDGGWSQLDDMTSDAYATGSALIALRRAGVSPDEQAYRKGIRQLMLSQHECGVWIVNTRSKPIQLYFDNGDPGGKSQFISTCATAWALLALLETIEKR